MHRLSGAHHQAWELGAMLGARAIEHRPFLILSWGHDWFSVALMACEPLLHWRDEFFLPPLPLYPLVPFSSWGQPVRSWREEVAEEHEEETWVEEEEA